MLRGKTVTLRPAEPRDMRPVYEWLAQSDLTSSMLGPPLFPDVPAPSWEQFRLEYPMHFFDGSRAESGRSYIIEVHQEAAGHINYDGMDDSGRYAELDIWMRSQRYCGHGYGTDAIRTLVSFLESEYHVGQFILRPSQRNPRAIGAYEAAGFRRQDMSSDEQSLRYGPGEYFDSVLLLKISAICQTAEGTCTTQPPL